MLALAWANLAMAAQIDDFSTAPAADSIPVIGETPALVQWVTPQVAPSPTPFPLPEKLNCDCAPEATAAAPPATPLPRGNSGSAPAILAPTAEITTEGRIEYVVIITVDGMRPDALERADTPVMDSLRARGAFSPRAQTVYISETLPAHASLISGMTPPKHGILWGMPYIGWPGMNGPTLFSLGHEAGLSTGMVFGKQKLHYMVLPDSADKLFGADAHDDEIKEEAVQFIRSGLPRLFFVHFPDTDRVGHKYGWLSPNQLYAIAYADEMIGEIVAALEEGHYMANTLLIITADHGGHGFRHGDDSPEDRTIPWLAVGPGVPQGVTLGSHIRIYDTAATALYVFDIPIPEKWDGQPVLEIFPAKN